MPDTLVLLFCLAIGLALLSWIVPTGRFDVVEVDGHARIALDSFRYEASATPPVTVFSGSKERLGLLNLPFEGLVSGSRTSSAVGIVAFLLVVGGAFGVILKTGSIDRGLRALIEKSRASPLLLLPLLFLLFSLGGAVFGMGEEAVPFILLLAPLLVRLGFDAITAVLVTLAATQIGFATSWMNPFSVAIAQGIAGLPPLSGSGFRIVMWIAFTLVGALFTVWYARRVRADPQSSLSYASDTYFRSAQAQQSLQAESHFGRVDMLNTLLLFAGLVWVIWGVTVREYYIAEIAAQFFAIGLAIGLLSVIARADGMSLDSVAAAFREGAGGMLPAALVVGLAKGLVLLLGGTDAQTPSVMNTILYTLAMAVGDLPEMLSALLMLVVQAVLNFFVPSGSGQAALTMPIMAPLGDLVGVSRQVAVLAFQLGDGLANLVVPTSAVLMGALGAARLEWSVWIRFLVPFAAILTGMAMLAVAIAVAIGFS
ncbi:MAG: putative basic amino acid antiporter YfcC [Dokdonella sp.]